MLARHYIHPSCKQDVELEVWKAMSTLFFSIFYSFFKRKKSPNIYNCKHDVVPILLLFGSLFFPLHVSLRVNVLKSLLRKAVSPFDSSHTHIHTKREKKFSFFYTAFSVEALQMASAPNKHRSNTKRIQQRKVMCAAVSGALQAAGPRTKNLRLLFSS